MRSILSPYLEPEALKPAFSLSLLLATASASLHAAVPPCPQDTHAEGATPPAGFERKCVTAKGLAEGPWLTWYSNGQLMSERSMKQGREHGRQRSWWPNGQLMMEGTSYEGNRFKGFKYWSIDGAPTELNLETDTVTKPLGNTPPAVMRKTP